MITVLDRYTSNYYRLSVPDKLPDFSHGDKLVFSHTDKNKTITSVGIYLGHDVDTDRTGRYQRALIGDEKIEFDEQQTLALSHFPEFKKQFKAKFNGSIPVTARYHIFTKQMYFYFYSEERYVFGDFVRDFQRHVQSAVFFFQIGAREAMRLSPATDHIRGCNGMNLCCKSTRKLPSVDIEAVLLQHLEGRDIERLKGRCGKLKCSLMHEVEAYIYESAKFPAKGQPIVIDTPACEKCEGIATSFNINTYEVDIKLPDHTRLRVPLQEVIWTERDKIMTERQRAASRRSHGHSHRSSS